MKREVIIMETHVEIPLTRGLISIVDISDMDLVASWTWAALRGRNGKFYAARNGSILMHREITGAQSSRMVIDHINGNSLDNRRANLRICSSAENLRNCGPNSRNKSGYKGVSWDRGKRKWYASICLNNKRIALGRYDSAMDAAKAYNESAIELFGEFAWLNKI